MNQPKSYYRIMLGKGSMYATECHEGSFIGVDFGLNVDFTNKLPEDWREFNKKYIPVYLKQNKGKSKIAAGLACGAIHTVSKGIKQGDIVLCPDGKGQYHVGEVVAEYSYHPDEILPHRRTVTWYPQMMQRDEASDQFRKSTAASGTVVNITQYADEIEQLISGHAPPKIIATDETIEDPSVFGLEKHLEEFLVQNWRQTELGKKYDIFVDETETGQQYRTDTGPIDILAISKDKKELLIVELKRGRASDVVVGQIQRYMGYVAEELAEEGQTVKGVIIALEKDLRLQRALRVTQNIEFYRYQVSFKLHKE